MPVGTRGSVKALGPDELEQLGAQIILGNTYHLMVRPGMEVMRHFGNLHSFAQWNRSLLTDSGGFQVFSLAKLRKITEEGVRFQNHVDGANCFLSPEVAMEVQQALGSDIAMVFDECPPFPCEHSYAKASLERTLRWAKRCKEWSEKCDRDSGRLVFGIVQGATFQDLREASARGSVEIGFDGYAIGGVSVGEPEEKMMESVEWSEPYLPQDKPRYAMGLGTPPQMVELVARGVDMFDCVLPTRLARNGTAFTRNGTVNLKNNAYRMDKEPIEPGCLCPVCRKFSRGYLRHLINVGEILALRLVTLHNVYFYLNLLREIRTSIKEGTFQKFRSHFSQNYKVHPQTP